MFVERAESCSSLDGGLTLIASQYKPSLTMDLDDELRDPRFKY